MGSITDIWTPVAGLIKSVDWLEDIFGGLDYFINDLPEAAAKGFMA